MLKLDEERDSDEGHNYQSGTSDEHSPVRGDRDVGGNLIPATLRRCFRWVINASCVLVRSANYAKQAIAQPCGPSTVLLC